MIYYFISLDFFFNSILPTIKNDIIKNRYLKSFNDSRIIILELINLHLHSKVVNTIYHNRLIKQDVGIAMMIIELESLNFTNY